MKPRPQEADPPAQLNPHVLAKLPFKTCEYHLTKVPGVGRVPLIAGGKYSIQKYKNSKN